MTSIKTLKWSNFVWWIGQGNCIQTILRNSKVTDSERIKNWTEVDWSGLITLNLFLSGAQIFMACLATIQRNTKNDASLLAKSLFPPLRILHYHLLIRFECGIKITIRESIRIGSSMSEKVWQHELLLMKYLNLRSASFICKLTNTICCNYLSLKKLRIRTLIQSPIVNHNFNGRNFINFSLLRNFRLKNTQNSNQQLPR